MSLLLFAELDKLKQFRHIDNWLEKKYQSDVPASVKIIVECENQTYEATVDSTALFLQPLVKKLLDKVKKNEEKITKKKGKEEEVIFEKKKNKQKHSQLDVYSSYTFFVDRSANWNFWQIFGVTCCSRTKDQAIY